MKRKSILHFAADLLLTVMLLVPLSPAGYATEPETITPTETTAADTSATEVTEEPLSTEPTESVQPAAEEADNFPDAPWKLYFGLLHAHTAVSDGSGSVEEAFSHAAQVEQLDFFAVTDHSNSFDNADAGAISLDGSAISEEWAAGKAAAAAVTGEDFLGLWGYEMTWRDDRLLGHINTFATPGWISRNQKGFNKLSAYYEALTTVSGSISQFNHPGPESGDFENFGHWEEGFDKNMALLEVGSGKGIRDEKWYTRALDRGWHVAPTVSQNNHSGNWGDLDDCRTVILAEALTEQSLYEAMAARRVYAAEDKNLSLWYELDGTIMGSTIAAKQAHTLTLWMQDTDGESALVEVITDGGAVTASAQTDGSAPLSLSVTGGGSYYYLRITQSDGDIALTAPVWTVGQGDTGISAFTADSDIPTAGDQVVLTLTVKNDMLTELPLAEVAVYAADSCIFASEMPVTLAAGQSRSFPVPYLRETPGQVTLRAVVRSSTADLKQTWEQEMTLSYREEETVSGLLLDVGHGQTQSFQNLGALAQNAGMAMTRFAGELPAGGDILVLPPPEKTFSNDFVAAAAAFVREGGLLILCGSREEIAAAEQNRILEAAGFTLRLRPDRAEDSQRFGADTQSLHTDIYNRYTSLCRNITEDQIYSHLHGCTVDLGQGIWLVKGQSTTAGTATGETAPVFLALEELPGGGRVLAAGSCFLSDEAMPLPDNIWDPPRIGQTILQNLLGTSAKPYYRQDTIADIRKGTPGTVYRAAGYATSGTSNPNNTFTKTLYIQDNTGGIALIPFAEEKIQIGTLIEVVGCLEQKEGKPVLNPITWRIPEQSRYQVEPEPRSNAVAMDYAFNGDCLVQVEATVTTVTLTEDGRGVSRFIMTDSRGDKAVVTIEDSITSGKFGINNLAGKVQVGRTVRAIGLVDTDETGAGRLRVRNCDEVVHVPPPELYNPYTGDGIFLPVGTGLLSLGLLAVLLKKKRT